MIETEGIHAPPQAGGSVSPCCGRVLAELPRYDRISHNPDLVTCGRLSPAEELMLSGQPVVLDPAHEQLLYSMASTVATLCGAITLQTAYEHVNTAVREILAANPQPLQAWSAALMVRVTSRAQELAY